jgi:hypothetical protein
MHRAPEDPVAVQLLFNPYFLGFVAMGADKNVKLFRVHWIRPTLYSLTIMVIVFLKARTEQKKFAEKKSKNYP